MDFKIEKKITCDIDNDSTIEYKYCNTGEFNVFEFRRNHKETIKLKKKLIDYIVTLLEEVDKVFAIPYSEDVIKIKAGPNVLIIRKDRNGDYILKIFNNNALELLYSMHIDIIKEMINM